MRRPTCVVYLPCSKQGAARVTRGAACFNSWPTCHYLLFLPFAYERMSRCCFALFCDQPHTPTPPPTPNRTTVVSVMLPTLISSTAVEVKDFRAELALSRFESVLMLVVYGLFLVFQLVTHR